MIQVNQIKFPITASSLKKHEEDLLAIQKAIHFLSISESDVISSEISKKSIDARDKTNLQWVYNLKLTLKNESRFRKNHSKRYKGKVKFVDTDKSYDFRPHGQEELSHRPVVVGSGPAGLFAAWFLAKEGYRPLILERGKKVEERKKDVEMFWNEGVLNPDSNVQFGEGGAGTFSDGKLNTSVNDKYGRNRKVLELFVHAGAPKNILYDSKPHIGTDILMNVVKNMRDEIEQNGGEFSFESTFCAFEQTEHKLNAVSYQKNGQICSIPCECLILATGHSSRDTFQMLHKMKIEMQAKSFAVGVRVSHPQKMINLDQYGSDFADLLPAAPYKLTAKAKNGRGVYTFCMCPGGYVVNASSEKHATAVNGMSYSGRNSGSANSAVIVTVTPQDYPDYGPLSGMYFQEELEQKAYKEGNGKIVLQCYGDFKKQQPSTTTGTMKPMTKGDYSFGNIRNILPAEICDALIDGMEAFGCKIHGYDQDDTLMMAVESRTSSPIRIHRNENFESNVSGIYPCGEGAGYAGGITSAAIDGIKVYEAIASRYAPLSES